MPENDVHTEKLTCVSNCETFSHFQLTWPLGHVSYCHHFSSAVCPSIFHILILSSETIGPIATKLWWNGPWMAPLPKLCSVIPTSNQDGRQAKNRKKGMKFKKKSSPLKLLSQSQPNFTEMILGWSLPKLCLTFQTSDQDGHHSRI